MSKNEHDRSIIRSSLWDHHISYTLANNASSLRLKREEITKYESDGIVGKRQVE